jgi:flagellar motor switch protein FliN/FliY
MAEAANAFIDVAAACRGAAADIAAAWKRAFGVAVTLNPGNAAAMPIPIPPAKLATAGLLLKLAGPSQQCWVAVPRNDAVLAAWCAQPDEQGQAALTNLAAELAPLLLGASSTPHQTQAKFAPNLLEALVEHLRVCPRLMSMPCAVTPSEGAAGAEAFFVWTMAPELEPPQAANQDAPADEAATAASAEASPADTSSQGPKAAAKPSAHHVVQGQQMLQPGPAAQPARVPTLPPYSRSLLKISVPVSVTLARKKQRASQILELGPGAIIQFDRSCEETLDLEVGGHRIAMGEAVKVGDKFGLRITELVNTEERFVPVRRENPAAPAAQAPSSKRFPVSRS